jgi:hypothetical protein
MTKQQKEQRKLERKKLKEWSKEVRTNDGWHCVYCNKENKRLNAHHLLPKQIYPQFKFDPKVGISLCPFSCHRRRAHYDGVAFTIWLMEHRPEQFEYIKSLLKTK